MDIFEQASYKEAIKLYLRNWGRPIRGAFKNIAEHLGVNPTLVSQVLSGPRDFSEEQMFAVCEYLGLPQLESQYLMTLLQIERAGTVALKKYYSKFLERIREQSQLVSSHAPKSRNLSDTEKATFYSNYIYSAIHIASGLEQNVTFDFICKRFSLSPARAREILDFLLETQLITEKNGKFSTGASFTHLDKKSPFVQKLISNWRLKAIDAAAEMTDEEIFYSANFSVSKKDFSVLRKKMVQVIQDFILIAKDSPAEDIAQFNLDLFWIKK